MQISKILSALLLSFASALALAGTTVDQPVEVLFDNGVDGAGTAFGNMVTARFSDNDVEFIGCGTRNISTPGFSLEFAFCQAADAAGVQAFCNTQNSDLVRAARAVADFSFITFSFDELGECQSMGFSTQSFYIPADEDGDDDDDDEDDDD